MLNKNTDPLSHAGISKDGGLEELEGHRGQGNFGRGGGGFGGSGPRGFGQNNYNQGNQNPYLQASSNEGGQTPVFGKTPAWGGRTPMHPPSDSRTPAWSVSRTPNPYASGAAAGGKTPVWNAQARTPAWNSSSRTPNPYADGGGARTPGWTGGVNPSPRDPLGLARTPTQMGQPQGWAGNSGWGGGETPRWNNDRTDTDAPWGQVSSYVVHYSTCFGSDLSNRAVATSMPHRLLRLQLLRQAHGETRAGEEEDGMIPGDRRVTLLKHPLRRLRHPLQQKRRVQAMPMTNTTVSVFSAFFVYITNILFSFSSGE